MKLSKEQERVLKLLKQQDRPLSSYQLNCRISTLRALADRGLARAIGEGRPGAFSMPSTAIDWVATHRAERAEV